MIFFTLNQCFPFWKYEISIIHKTEISKFHQKIHYFYKKKKSIFSILYISTFSIKFPTEFSYWKWKFPYFQTVFSYSNWKYFILKTAFLNSKWKFHLHKFEWWNFQNEISKKIFIFLFFIFLNIHICFWLFKNIIQTSILFQVEFYFLIWLDKNYIY